MLLPAGRGHTGALGTGQPGRDRMNTDARDDWQADPLPPEPRPRDARQELAAAVHELRTPLATVRGFLETLLARGDELSPDAQQHILRIARRNAVLLGQRIDTLLDHERFAAGHMQLVPRPEVLAEVVTEIVEDCAGLLTQHPVEVAIPDDLVAHVDTVALAHVLGNLLSNAAKHSAAGAPIAVRARPAGRRIDVEVVDLGDGIPAEDIDRVFDPFFQVDHGPSGMGLGLSVVGRYVALWGGHLNIDSVPGEGTTVAFSVPAAGPDHAAAAHDEVRSSGES